MQCVLDRCGGDGDFKDCTAKMWSAEFEQRAPSYFCRAANTGGDGAGPRGDGAVLRGDGAGPKGDGAGPEAMAMPQEDGADPRGDGVGP